VVPGFVCGGPRLLLLSGLALCAFPTQASAEWQLAPFIGWTFAGSTTLASFEGGEEKVHWTFGGTATLLGAGPLGAEGLFIYTPGFFGSGPVVNKSRALALMGNVLLTVPRGWNEYGLRPFVSGGVGWMHASIELFQDVLPIRENLLGFNVGGGAVGFLSERTGLRFDLRYFRHLKPLAAEGVSVDDVRLSYWSAAVGVVFKY
jgi:hypothetical protein